MHMCIGSLSLEKMSQVFKKVFSSVFVWNTVASEIDAQAAGVSEDDFEEALDAGVSVDEEAVADNVEEMFGKISEESIMVTVMVF